MSDSMPYQQCRQLKEEGEQHLRVKQYGEASKLFKQAYDLCPDGFSASKYIKCLCRTGEMSAREAVTFARKVVPLFPNNRYIKEECAWALYFGYLKIPGPEENDDEEDEESEESKEKSHIDFATRVNAARNVFKLTSDPLTRKQAVFAICKEAKLLKKWELMYEFAQQLDPKTLSREQKELGGRPLKSDYQRWLFYMTRVLLELDRYDECILYAHEAIAAFPQDCLYFRWWEGLAKIRLGQVQEGLSQLEHVNIHFPKQWYIQRDIANAYVRLGQYDDAWLWFCRAVTMPGDIKGRVVILRSMCDLLQRFERWQEVYEHLRLVWAVEAAYDSQRYAEKTRQRIDEFRRRYAEYLQTYSETENTATTVSSALKPCRIVWQKSLRKTGTITYINADKRFGFIVKEADSFKFSFDDFASKNTPEVGMHVEFEPQDSFDRKKDKPGKIALSIRVVKKIREEQLEQQK